MLYSGDFFCKGSDYILGFVVSKIANKATQLSHCSEKAAIHNTLPNDCSYVPIKLKKQSFFKDSVKDRFADTGYRPVCILHVPDDR